MDKELANFLLKEAARFHRSDAIHEAISRYKQVLAIDAKNGEAAHLLGLAYAQQGNFDNAVRMLRKALKRSPGNALLQTQLGEALQATGQLKEALQCFNRALSLQPHLAEAHAGRGNVLAALDRHDEAIASFDAALGIDPNFAEAWVNRGNSLRDLKRPAEALQSYDTAIRLRPQLAEAHFSRGLVLEGQDQFEQAIDSFNGALKLFDQDPVWLARVYSHRGIAHHYLSHSEAALADARQSVELAPNDDEIVYAASFIELLRGYWLEAWPKAERRLPLKHTIPKDFVPPPFPMWNGEPLTDELLVLRGEQGLGDHILFSCFAADLARRGNRIALWTKPVLVDILKTVPGIELVIRDIKELKHVGPARWLHMMSLPHILRTTPDSIPAVVPFLSADPERIATWRNRLGSDGFKIGIVWQGNPTFQADNRRSIPLKEFAPLAEIPGIRLVSLQKRPGAEQIATVDFHDRIEAPTDAAAVTSEALLDTAAILMNMDLVVTSDTMIAHLASALGCRTFIALGHVPDWRWLLDRDDCPWYPTARLFRQTRFGDWAGVFQRIATAARELASAT